MPTRSNRSAGSMSLPYYFFGTLRDADLRALVFGRSFEPPALVEAGLADHTLRRMVGEDYPVLVPAAGEAVAGLCVHGVTGSERRRLRWFEGDEYDEREVEVVSVDGATVNARLFAASTRVAASAESWDFERWQERHKAFLIERVRVYMSFMASGDLASAEAAWRRMSRGRPPLS